MPKSIFKHHALSYRTLHAGSPDENVDWLTLNSAAPKQAEVLGKTQRSILRFSTKPRPGFGPDIRLITDCLKAQINSNVPRHPPPSLLRDAIPHGGRDVDSSCCGHDVPPVGARTRFRSRRTPPVCCDRRDGQRRLRPSAFRKPDRASAVFKHFDEATCQPPESMVRGLRPNLPVACLPPRGQQSY